MKLISKFKNSIQSRITLYSRKFIVFLAKISKVDLILTGYRYKGISNSGNSKKTGEKFVIEEILPKLIKKNNPVFFDVGANIGEYSTELRKNFTQAEIYSFEPNTKVFDLLNTNTAGLNIKCNNIGFGPEISKAKLYSYQNSTGLGTIKREALEILYKSDEKIEEIDFSISTIDDFCIEKGISSIDFLKIDVEGQELGVIQGTKKMIFDNRCPIIQFEFNNFHVIYRVYMKDFYDELSGYDFYRIKTGGLVPMGYYDTIHEIFKFQNIIAISKKLEWKNKI